MFQLLKQKYVWRILGLVLLDIVVFTSTDANRTSSYMLIIGFILISLTVYYLIQGLISLSALYGLKVKNSRMLARYLTIVLAILLALQSIGELGARDIWVLLPLSVVAYLYSVYAKTSTRNLRS